MSVFKRVQIIACNNGGDDTICSAAQSYCNGNILGPLAGNWDVYYVPTANPDPYPPQLATYLNSTAVTSKIGSQSPWVMINYDVYDHFASTGDWMRSKRSNLEMVIDAGVRTVLYDGDADYICNYMGFEAMVCALCLVLPVLSGFCADTATAYPDCNLKHGVLAAVREAGLRDLYGKG